MPYHVNSQGQPGQCAAAKDNCPFGSAESDHYPTAGQARAAFEASMGSQIPKPINAAAHVMPSRESGPDAMRSLAIAKLDAGVDATNWEATMGEVSTVAPRFINDMLKADEVKGSEDAQRYLTMIVEFADHNMESSNARRLAASVVDSSALTFSEKLAENGRVLKAQNEASAAWEEAWLARHFGA